MRETIDIKNFPYEYLRFNQKNIIDDVYKTHNDFDILLLNAQTGIGKTISVLYPTIKYANDNDKFIIYLTNRKTQHNIVNLTLNEIRNKGLKIKSLDIINKFEMCIDHKLLKEVGLKKLAHMERCNFYKKNNLCEYYNNIKDYENNIDLFDKNNNTKEIINKCQKYSICPHAYILENLKNCNMLICDYSYIFSNIKKIIMEKLGRSLEDCILIIDEAHNIFQRVKHDNEISITKNELKYVMTKFEETTVKKFINVLIESEYFKQNDGKINLNNNFLKRIAIKNGMKLEDILFLIGVELSYIKNKVLYEKVKKLELFLYEWYENSPHYAKYLEIKKPSVKLTLEVLNLKYFVNDIFNQINSAILMSGTLFPKEMYIDLLGLKEHCTKYVTYKSDFPEVNKVIKIYRNLTTDFNKRGKDFYENYALKIEKIINPKRNIIIFFISYKMMEYTLINVMNNGNKFFKERQNLSLKQKEYVIKQFENNKGITLFAVFGGSYYEGIDFKNIDDIIIAGVQYPPPSTEIITQLRYYKNFIGDEKASEYVYRVPAIQKVIQAYGRAIRKKEDKVTVHLLDYRYLDKELKKYIEFYGGKIEII